MGSGVVTVWLLMHWSAYGQARGDIFPAARPMSQHETAAACEDALQAVLKERYGAWSCIQAVHRPAPRNPNVKRTTTDSEGTCTGDDRFCGRIPWRERRRHLP